MSSVVHLGDCLDILRELPDNSVDAVVTDPPYGLEFMGKEWDSFRTDDREVPGWNGREGGNHGEASGDVGGDYPSRRNNAIGYGGGKRPTTFRCEGCGKRDQFRKPHTCPEDTNWRRELIDPHAAPPTMLAYQNWTRTWALEALRVLKPGGHALVFGGTRTYHRLASGLEDAGFEIRDTLAWMYGSGFPKSLDVSKAIDARLGEPREVRQYVKSTTSEAANMRANGQCQDCGKWKYSPDPCRCARDNGPQTDDARTWNGWGTALKPAYEPITLARKPLQGTVAANVLAHGTGALNVDATRIEGAKASGSGQPPLQFGGDNHRPFHDTAEPREFDVTLGRWPANVTLDPEAAHALDQQTGELASGKMMPTAVRSVDRSAYGNDAASGYTTMETYGDSGGASRFYYVAKTSRAERNAGLDGFEEREKDQRYGDNFERGRNPITGERLELMDRQTRNHHPTVKPIALMRWLVRLITPPGGTVLDPFTGSGTTGIACALEGLQFIGIEREPDYHAIAQARIHWWAQHGEAALEEVRRQEQAENQRQELSAMGQLSLLG